MSFWNKRSARVSQAADGAFAISASASPLTNPTTGGILAGSAGSLTLTVGGVAGIVVTVVAGQYVPIVATHITAISGTGHVGLYHR